MTIYAKKKYFPIDSLNDLCEFPADAMIHALKALSAQENSKIDEYL